MPQDIDLLQGSWSIKSLALEGQEMPAAMFVNASMVVQGNRFTSSAWAHSTKAHLSSTHSQTPTT